MTQKLFWKDPYQTHLVTEVTSVAAAGITLKETIFYALPDARQYLELFETAGWNSI